MLLYEIVSKRVHMCFYLLTIYYTYGNLIYVHITFAYGVATRHMFFVIKITHYMTHNVMTRSQTEVAVTR